MTADQDHVRATFADARRQIVDGFARLPVGNASAAPVAEAGGPFAEEYRRQRDRLDALFFRLPEASRG